MEEDTLVETKKEIVNWADLVVTDDEYSQSNTVIPIQDEINAHQQEVDEVIPIPYPQEEKSLLDKLVDLVVKDINFVKSMDRSIVEDQERTWLSFSVPISQDIKYLLPRIVKEKTGLMSGWDKNNDLVIEFFGEDELAEVRHRKALRAQKEKGRTEKEPPKKEYTKKEYPRKSSFSSERNYRSQHKNVKEEKPGEVNPPGGGPGSPPDDGWRVQTSRKKKKDKPRTQEKKPFKSYLRPGLQSQSQDTKH